MHKHARRTTLHVNLKLYSLPLKKVFYPVFNDSTLLTDFKCREYGPLKVSSTFLQFFISSSGPVIDRKPPVPWLIEEEMEEGRMYLPLFVVHFHSVQQQCFCQVTHFSYCFEACIVCMWKIRITVEVTCYIIAELFYM